MNRTDPVSPIYDAVKDHLANERTFLAWIRTSIGIMAFGFVLEKFSLFIKQVSFFLTREGHAISPDLSSEHQSFSSAFGIFLIGFGALIALLAFIKYKKTTRQIEKNDYIYSSALASIVTACIVIIGIFLTIYLIVS